MMHLLNYQVWERHSRHKVGGKECYLGFVVWGSGRGLDGGYKVRLLGEVPSLVKKKILGHKEVIEGIYYCDQFATLKRTPYIKKK
jgi:hypothetical protein